MYIIFWELYVIIRYHEVLFFLRLLRDEQYSFAEYAMLLIAVCMCYGILSSRFDKCTYKIIKNCWDDFKIIWHDIVKPLEDAKYDVALLLLFFSIFGYEIFNFTLSLDEEIHMTGLMENSTWCYEGRFSITLLKNLLMEFGMYQPCLSNLLGAVLLLLAGLCIFSLISDKLCHDKVLSFVFLAGFLSFPSVTFESQTFSTYCIEISFGIFCTSLAAVYFKRYLVTRLKRNIIINIILLAFSLGIYQSMAELYFTLLIIYFLVAVLNEEYVTNQKAVDYLKMIFLSGVILGVALALFFMIYKVATTIHCAPDSIEYINSFSGWDLEYGIIASLIRSVKQLVVVLSQTQIPGIKFFSYYMIVGVLLTIFFIS